MSTTGSPDAPAGADPVGSLLGGIASAIGSFFDQVRQGVANLASQQGQDQASDEDGGIAGRRGAGGDIMSDKWKYLC